jgi:hypothetical protein
MSNEEESREDYSPLVERIKQVFADVPYPGDDNIIGTPEHVAVCDECSGLHDALAGRRWPELIDDEEASGHVDHAMSFFSPAGWHYYLPAYLIQRVNRRQFSSRHFSPRTDPGLVEFWEERVSRLTGDQCRAVIAYLLFVLREDDSSRYARERNREAAEHWKENYRKIASQNEGAG